MRQIAKEQSVRFVASYPLTATIKSLGKKEITSDDLLCYAKHIQTTTTLEENYKTVLEQLKEIFLEECEKLLDRRLDKKVFVMMIRKNPFDPIASWATSSCMTEPEFVFRKVKEMLMGQLKTHLTSEEVGNVEKRMETLIQRALKKDDCQVPDHVSSQQAFSEGREAELQREQVQEQQQQSVQEQQQQQQQMQTIHLSQGGSSSTHQIPLFDPDLFVRCDLQNRCSLKQVPDQDDAEGVTIELF